MKEVGRIWQVITKEELEYFKEKSRKDMVRYKEEHSNFIRQINELRKIGASESKKSTSDKNFNTKTLENSTRKNSFSQINSVVLNPFSLTTSNNLCSSL